MQRRTSAILLAGFLVLFLAPLAGCGMLDTFFGYTPGGDAPPAGSDPSGGGAPSDAAGGILSLLPYGQWAAMGLGIFRWFYIEIRKRQMDASFKAVVLGIKGAIDVAGGQPINKDLLYNSITEASKLYANREVFYQLVDRIKAEYDKNKSKS